MARNGAGALAQRSPDPLLQACRPRRLGEACPGQLANEGCRGLPGLGDSAVAELPFRDRPGVGQEAKGGPELADREG